MIDEYLGEQIVPLIAMFYLMSQFHQQYILGKELGNGTYGTVYEVTEIKTNKVYACKKIELRDDYSPFCLYNELTARKLFDHPNLVRIYDVLVDEVQYIDVIYTFYIIMEKCDHTLSYLMRQKMLPTDKQTKIDILEQIISGLLYMYYRGYVHYDLSLSNIMLKDGQVKIIDFGFMFQRNVKLVHGHSNTVYIRTPELTNLQIVDLNKVDTWAIGIIFYVICYGKYFINYESEESYLWDVATIEFPPLILLQKNNLFEAYCNSYSKKCSDKKSFDNLKDIDKYQQIKQYVSQLPINHCLHAKSPENNFIKGLLVWDAHQRPDIVGVYQSFSSIFSRVNHISSKIIDMLYFYKQPSIPIMLKSKFSLQLLAHRLMSYAFLFQKDEQLIDCHLPSKSSDLDKENLDLIVKTIIIFSRCRQITRKDPSKAGLIHKMVSGQMFKEGRDDKKNIGIYYSIVSIIFQHEYLTSDFWQSPLLCDAPNEKEIHYLFLRLFDFHFFVSDAWNYVEKFRLDPKYQSRYQFLYYLMLSTSQLVLIQNRHLFEALIYLIIASENKKIMRRLEIDMKMVADVLNTYLFKKESNKNLDEKSLLKSSLKHFYHHSNMPPINLSVINANSAVIAYYCLRTIKKIPVEKHRHLIDTFLVSNSFIMFLKHCLELAPI